METLRFKSCLNLLLLKLLLHLSQLFSVRILFGIQRGDECVHSFPVKTITTLCLRLISSRLTVMLEKK